MTAVRSGAVDEITYRVLAPNPSPLTLDGTNTYLLGAPGSGERIVVDPGPALRTHRTAIEQALVHLDAAVVAVVVTHHHVDHAGAAGWAGEWAVPLHAFDPDLVPGAAALPADALLSAAGVAVTAVHTPGHASDHLCLRIDDTGVVLSGDHVLGRGTSVVSWPDGDLAAYLASLRRLQALQPVRLDPGHGPSLERPADAIAHYLAHRAERSRQILDAVEAGAATPGTITARVYADVDPVLHPAAERSVRAHLRHLADSGMVLIDDLERPDAAVRRAG